MIKTITLDGLTSVTVKESPFDMARFCWVRNRTESDVYISCTDPQCTPNADGVKCISAGECGMLDSESRETLYISGSGMVNIETSPFAVCPFSEGKKGGGTSLSGSAAYTINNAVDYPLMGLNLYGKSTQDGTPTPDNPVDIVSVGDSGSVGVTACGKNLFPWNDYTKIPNECYQVEFCEKTTNEIKFKSVKDNASVFYILSGTVKENIPLYYGQTVTISAEIKSDTQAHMTLGLQSDFKRFLSTNNWQKISHTFIYYALDGIGGNLIIGVEGDATTIYLRNILIEFGDTATDYEPYIGTTANITTALPLCGIPVDSGGNHTDKNGQQWICDELVYNADGTGKIVKRTEKIKLSSNNMNIYHTNEKRAVYSIQQHIVSGNSISYTKCNRLIPAHGGGFSYETGGKYYINNQLLFVYIQNFGVDTESDWKNYVDNNDVIVYHAVQTPTIIELTAAEVDALRTLQTFDGTTSISNSAGAEMSVKYCTNKALSEFVYPVITGLQKEINELKSAILSMGGNV